MTNLRESKSATVIHLVPIARLFLLLGFVIPYSRAGRVFVRIEHTYYLDSFYKPRIICRYMHGRECRARHKLIFS